MLAISSRLQRLPLQLVRRRRLCPVQVVLVPRVMPGRQVLLPCYDTVLVQDRIWILLAISLQMVLFLWTAVAAAVDVAAIFGGSNRVRLSGVRSVNQARRMLVQRRVQLLLVVRVRNCIWPLDTSLCLCRMQAPTSRSKRRYRAVCQVMCGATPLCSALCVAINITSVLGFPQCSANEQ